MDLSDVSQWFDNIGNGTSPMSRTAMLIPALGAAYQQWNNAGQYRDTARDAARISNPFGDERAGYITRMRQLYDDPSGYLNSPAYQAQLNHGLDAVARNNASKGYLGSGNMTADLMDYAHVHDQEALDAEKKNLLPLTGAQFNPASAGEMLMRGNDQAINAQNGALAAVGQLLKPGNSTNITNGGNGGGGPGNGNIPIGGGRTIPVDRILQGIQNSGMSGASAMQLFQRILSSPEGLDPSTVAMLRDIGIDTNVDTGGMDYAPPGYYDDGGAGYVPGGFGATDPIGGGSPFDANSMYDWFTNPGSAINLDAIDFDNFDFMGDLGAFGLGG